MIRPANFSDIPGIVGLMEEGFRRSHYANDPRCAVDTKEAKRLLVTAIQRHGHKTGGGCYVAVSETDGILTGFIVGTLARAYSVGNMLMATDLFWYASPGVHPTDPAALMGDMIAWARVNPDVIEIRCGATHVIDTDDRAGTILKRLGFKPHGSIHRMEVTQ
jgi:hypothetical protein